MGERVMPSADWRSPAAYEALRSLDAPGFAWEYLNRNPDFHSDLRRLAAQAARDILSVEDEAGFARRWGLRFRCRPRFNVAQSVLDTRGLAVRARPRRGSTGLAEFCGRA